MRRDHPGYGAFGGRVDLVRSIGRSLSAHLELGGLLFLGQVILGLDVDSRARQGRRVGAGGFTRTGVTGFPAVDLRCGVRGAERVAGGWRNDLRRTRRLFAGKLAGIDLRRGWNSHRRVRRISRRRRCYEIERLFVSPADAWLRFVGYRSRMTKQRSLFAGPGEGPLDRGTGRGPYHRELEFVVARPYQSFGCRGVEIGGTQRAQQMTFRTGNRGPNQFVNDALDCGRHSGVVEAE